MKKVFKLPSKMYDMTYNNMWKYVLIMYETHMEKYINFFFATHLHCMRIIIDNNLFILVTTHEVLKKRKIEKLIMWHEW